MRVANCNAIVAHNFYSRFFTRNPNSGSISVELAPAGWTAANAFAFTSLLGFHQTGIGQDGADIIVADAVKFSGL